MGDTFYSTSQAMAADMVATHPTGSVTAPVSADGSFYSIAINIGATTYTLRDSDLSSGSTTPTLSNYMQSWMDVTGAIKVQAVLTAPGDLATLQDVAAALNILMSALVLIAEHCTNYSSFKIADLEWPGSGTGSYHGYYTVGVIVGSSPAEYYTAATSGGGNYAASSVGYNLGGMTIETEPTAWTSFAYVDGNWGRAGMVVPLLGASTQVPKITCPNKACSENIVVGDYLVPTEWPITWMAGPYGEYYFSPELLDIYYPGNNS